MARSSLSQYPCLRGGTTQALVLGRDIVYTDIIRGFYYAVILFIIHVSLIAVDLIRLARRVIPQHRGYFCLFVAHIIFVGILAAYLILNRITRTGSTRDVRPIHTGLAVGFSALFLFFCTAISMIHQLINGQITIYVIGCMTLAVCEKIRSSVDRYNWHVVADRLGLTISIGVTGHTSSDTLTSLLQRADERLYSAKRAGRNRVVGKSEDDGSRGS